MQLSHSNNVTTAETPSRLIGLDLFRIIAVLFVFLFHSNGHFGCTYGFLTDFVKEGAIYMTAFFLLSGFSLYYTWNGRELHRIDNIKSFFVKRIACILPLYYAVYVLYLIFYPDKQTVIENILLAPIEILGIQSTFTSLFNYINNGGTWFISCLIICYLIYPYIQETVKQISTRTKIIIIAIAAFILIYSPFIQTYFKTGSIYADPFFRLLEFIIGVILCSMIGTVREGRYSHILSSWYFVILEFILLVLSVMMAQGMGIPKNIYMQFNFVALPLFMLLLVSMSNLSIKNLKSNGILERTILYLSKISYAFFLAQFFTWDLSSIIINYLGMDGNTIRILISFSVCLLISIALNGLVEKPVKQWILKHTPTT